MLISAFQNILCIQLVSSLVSRLVRVQETSGSNPDTPTKNVGIAFAVLTFLYVLELEQSNATNPDT